LFEFFFDVSLVLLNFFVVVGVLLVVNSLRYVSSEDNVGPPVDGEGAVSVRYYFWLRRELCQVEVLLK